MIFVGMVIVTGAFFMILERIFPDQTLPKVQGWWGRVIIINAIQAALVVVAGETWDVWFQQISVLRLDPYFHPALGGFLCYLLLTFIYYFWHRARHDFNFLWLSCHQLHHSPNRIETITAFYKHPFEIFCNSMVIGVTIYVFLGFGPEAGGWVTFYSAFGEFIYHMNIRTPHWLGYFIQRPEMHRIHHQRDKHYSNFADLPIWDMMFGTYKNPKTYQGKCGFKVSRETQFIDILKFKNVNGPYTEKKRFMQRPVTTER